MAKTRPCTKCGHINPVDAIECGGCAVVFRDVARGKDSGFHIPDSCEYVTTMQERCRYPATISSSTNGSGPWFCRFHFWDRHSSMADHMVEASRDFDPQKPKDPEPTADELEDGAQKVAVRFGVDPNLSPKERCLAVLKAWEAKQKKAA